MKKARAHLAGCINHGGDPRGVATWSHVRDLAKVGAEMLNDPAQLTRGFNDKAGVQFGATLAYQLSDLQVQCFDFLRVKRNLVFPFLTPSLWPIESTGGEIGRQE